MPGERCASVRQRWIRWHRPLRTLQEVSDVRDRARIMARMEARTVAELMHIAAKLELGTPAQADKHRDEPV